MDTTFKAIATLVGTTIGAGMFGIPFVVSKIGFFPGLVYLVVLSILNLVLNLVYGEITLRTPGDRQLTGYGEIYLGKAGKTLATITLIFALYGALLAYLIKIGDFLGLIFGIENHLISTLLFFVFAAFSIYFGLRSVSFFEVLITIFLLGLVFLVFILGFPKIDFNNFAGTDISFLLLPYGVIFFALHGFSVIPEMEEILRKEPQKLKKAIIIGSLIPLFVYILFTIAIVGICGSSTTDDAILGLTLFLPSFIVNIGAILGVLAMGSSFLTVGYVLREVWFRDFKVPEFLSFLLACFPSLILFLAGAKSFIPVLGITGAVSGGLNGILILNIFRKVKRIGIKEPAYSLNLPRILLVILFLIFLLGALSPFIRISH